MTDYSDSERRIIVADGFAQLNYRQKKLFLASLNKANADRQKYADCLIKMLGGGVYNKLKATMEDEVYCNKVLADIAKHRVRCITIRSAHYPEELRHISAPPLVLYIRGNGELLKAKKLTVVGSRRSTPQALEECRKLCGQIGSLLVIVTGVADGADSAAIKGALPGGNIICVLPGGHDSGCAANGALLAKAEAVGLSVSEFPPLFRAQRYTFILRNRIMAGLSLGTLVVSAAAKSGALSTAAFAADYGRDVFAFPYSIGIPSGEGCNALIKKGASLAENALDIVSAFGLELPVEKAPDLDEGERAVIAAIRQLGEAHALDIAQHTGRPLWQVGAICSSLELKGAITRLPGNKFSAI